MRFTFRRPYSMPALAWRSGVFALALLVSACSLPIALGPIGVPRPPAPPSPLLFGTNMGLFTANDQIVTNPATQQLLRANGRRDHAHSQPLHALR